MKKIFLDLLKQPITNSYLSKLDNKNIKKEFFYNLKISYDTKNHLVSIFKPINPKKQYTDQYAHRASESMTMRKSFKSISKKLIKKFRPRTLMEIGSNDGVFIKNFSKKKVIAVEPCKNLAKITNRLGYYTYDKFWDLSLAKKITSSHGKFDLIYSANTISHIPKLNETFKSIYLSLSKNGVFVFEDPYIGSVIKHNSYDQFYDEHVHLFSLLAMSNLVKTQNLKVIDVELLSTHGGSIRFYVARNNSDLKLSKNVKKIYNLEKNQKLHKYSTYKKFAISVKKSKLQLNKILKNLKNKGERVISYGATYKSTTIYNYCNIDSRIIEFVTDSTKNKQGKFTPGKHIKIIPPIDLINEKINYVFLGAWNFAKEISIKEKKFLNNGGKFITHVPKPRILRRNEYR